jgi:DNA-binding GntR family transcriptional regulator
LTICNRGEILPAFGSAAREGAVDQLEVLRTSTLQSVLEKELEKAVLSGELAPGGRVNENALAARFGISRGPIREALRALEASGLVHSIPNRGFFVRRLDLDEAVHIYDVRAVLFGLAGETLANIATEQVVAGLNRYIADMEQAAEARDFDAYYPLNLAFHRYIIESTGNPVLAGLYLDLVKQMHLFRARSLGPGGGLAVSNAEHREMVEAVMRRDPRAAREAFTAHVTRAKRRLLAAEGKDTQARNAGSPGG